MAGYIINLKSLEALERYIEHGVYSTILSTPERYWKQHHEATFGDYATMKPGDNIYFFINRKIYGIGELVEIIDNCKFLNFPEANNPIAYPYNDIQKKLLWDEGSESSNQRWICTFKPSPCFFKEGLDMDDVLASNPSKFRMLRAFWKVSFIKIDDEENQALLDYILRNNIDNLSNSSPDNIFQSNYKDFHNGLVINIGEGYNFNVHEILHKCSNGDRLRHEMAIEAGILHQISINDDSTIAIFGNWDYLSQQVVASPFKPIDYMDKMDIFGYKYIEDISYSRTKYKFLVMEIKKDTATEEDIAQLMKYVDWVKDEYTYGDFSMIKAFLVAYDFTNGAINNLEDICKRQYIFGRRPVKFDTWKDLWLVKYRYEDILKFDII